MLQGDIQDEEDKKMEEEKEKMYILKSDEESDEVQDGEVK